MCINYETKIVCSYCALANQGNINIVILIEDFYIKCTNTSFVYCIQFRIVQETLKEILTLFILTRDTPENSTNVYSMCIAKWYTKS